jgi:replicative superfamily II helicase
MRDIVSDAIEMSKGQELFYLIPLTKIAEEFYLKIFNKLTEKTKKKVSSFEDLKKLSLSEKDIVATTNIIVLLEG